MKYYIIAGEASGDLHGSNLMKELKVADKDADFRFFGGDKMQAVGGELVKHYREMAFMGFVNVILNIKTIKRNMEFCKKDLLNYKPDVLILIDYPGFNLRISEFAKQNNIKVYYYISPKLWAWKEYRVKKVRAFVDEMFTIFPFETAFYKKHGIDVNYVGNPLFDSIKEFEQKAQSAEEFKAKNNLDERPIISLLAGSRVQEIKGTLPVMKKAVEGRDDYQVVLAGVSSVDKELYNGILQGSNIKVLYESTYDLLNNAHTALVASGTAALETALFHVPQTVLYKVEGGVLVHYIMAAVLKIDWVSLPNIILGKMAVKELLQKDMTVKKVTVELDRLLGDEKYRESILSDYGEMQKLMGEPGCSKRAAEKMVELLSLCSEHKS
ncbi:lipid-A-disaccharide synthase [Draconibacterium sp. IB214405]|uniref:lipid-A-disaccharide synthase n=1 Tax=Draconibacterium sp. IB214405 TaxID=3097352 RepID=UPI002A17FB49|nr:lipid-A-disaccharide synthase [Draconibacterium sp. IB214405]MDX8340631.1 lipid-A-disaccharide synthase [Draconibacterium sp. IB214405]